MLINFETLFNNFNLNIKGILHVGAHECEEYEEYIKYVKDNNIHWIEAIPEKVDKMKKINNKLNIYNYVVSDKDGETVKFNISNNGQSSSILEFGTHKIDYPFINYVDFFESKTTRLDTIIDSNKISNINFINLDIQGTELKALKSLGKYLQNIKYIYTEVNTKEVYKDCCLLQDLDEFLKEKGFIRVMTSIYEEYGWGDAFYINLS